MNGIIVVEHDGLSRCFDADSFARDDSGYLILSKAGTVIGQAAPGWRSFWVVDESDPGVPDAGQPAA